MLLRAEDAWLIPFALIWCFFALPGALSRVISGGFFLFDLLFLVVGLYFLVGRFLVDMWLRARTYYGLTEGRALIVTRGFSERLHAVQLRSLSDLRLTMRRGGTGTIELGKPKFSLFAPRTSRATPWLGAGQYLPPAFEAIPDARHVYDMIVQMQHQAQQR